MSFSGLRHRARFVESHFPHRTFQGSRADRLGLQALLSALVTENVGRLAVEGVFGRKGELDWEQNWGRGFGLGRRPARRALESIGWLIMAALALSSDDPLLEVSAMCPKPIDEENLRSMEFPQVSSSSQCKKFSFYFILLSPPSYTLICLSTPITEGQLSRLNGILASLHNRSDMHAIEFVDDSGCVAQRL